MSFERNILSTFFDLHAASLPACEPLEAGLINMTYMVTIPQGSKEPGVYILQKINPAVFKNPEVIMASMDVVAAHLARQDYPDEILRPLRNRQGALLSYDQMGSAWRLLPFIIDSVCVQQAASPQQAYESARTFSRFYAYLWTVDLAAIQPAIPNFLDFAGRMVAFQQALPAAEEGRKQTAEREIAFVTAHLDLAAKFIVLQTEQLPLRLIHGDPKISNLLFDRTGIHGRCVIDLDTLMPGTVLYDYGDMIRSYTNNRAEDDPAEQDVFNAEVYDAVTAGFLYYLQDKLTAVEKENLHYSAQVVIFIQAIRFLTDYLNGDIYYKTTYPLQNLYRTRNQINLLRALLEKGK